MYIADLYILVTKDSAGNIVGYPKSFGSSTKQQIIAFDNLESAKRSQRFKGGTIMRVTAVEEAE
ncbi:hypothetical protein [Aneurinibacillus aneurinilyticus]|uniref:Uncharacterized protein n=1 Tax=Aneurinibacillus aneurinilyticus TaxID=1391 RepID=A0A848CY45_ANEAE|nr:hypothetical protein [Aneurinibacillus aneurinilyticus]NMF00049.1 hypothetical protein [Aneurinibacillus aneurinilyticus]